MEINQQQFQVWFEKPLMELINNSSIKDDAGYAILLISIPILERYLREKSKSYQQTPLPKAFYDALHDKFPEIPRNKAEDFYGIFRNGLVHQVTIRAVKGKGSAQGQIQNAGSCIAYNASKNHFSVHPEAFARRVLNIINSDFSTFEAPGSRDHPLGKIELQNNMQVTMSITLPTNSGSSVRFAATMGSV